VLTGVFSVEGGGFFKDPIIGIREAPRKEIVPKAKTILIFQVLRG
jgi:hypothetical protein